MADAVDWDDPCARYAALRSAYYNALSGNVRSISFQTGENTQSVTYGPTDVTALRNEMIAAQRECTEASGVPALPARHAIQFGARRAAFEYTGDEEE